MEQTLTSKNKYEHLYIKYVIYIYFIHFYQCNYKEKQKRKLQKIGAYFDTLPVMPILSVVFKFFLLLCYADFFIKPDQAMNKEKDI